NGIGHRSGAGTSIVNAIHFPSGDHAMSDGDSSSRVICVTAPSASIHRTKICDPRGSPRAMNAIRVPSGDHRAEEPSISFLCLEPSAFMIQSDDSQRSLTLSTHPRVKTICRPSGERRGSETRSQSRYMARVSARIDSWAAADGATNTVGQIARRSVRRLMTSSVPVGWLSAAGFESNAATFVDVTQDGPRRRALSSSRLCRGHVRIDPLDVAEDLEREGDAPEGRAHLDPLHVGADPLEDLAGDRDPLLQRVLLPLLARAAHPIEDRIRHADARHLVRQELGVARGDERPDPGDDRDADPPSVELFQEGEELFGIEDGLSDRVLGAGLDLPVEAPQLVLEVDRAGVRAH